MAADLEKCEKLARASFLADSTCKLLVPGRGCGLGGGIGAESGLEASREVLGGTWLAVVG